MGKAIAGPRVFRKSAAEVQAKADEYIQSLSDDYTITLRVNGEECPLDSFAERATANSRAELIVTHDTIADDRRVELFTIIPPSQTRNGGGLDAVTSELANTFKQYNEMLPKLVQTVGDMNRVVQEQNKGQLAMAKAMRKTLKLATKAIKQSGKDRARVEEQDGMAGMLKGIIKESSDALGKEFTQDIVRDLIGEGLSLFGSRKIRAAGPGPGGSEAISENVKGGEDPGPDKDA